MYLLTFNKSQKVLYFSSEFSHHQTADIYAAKIIKRVECSFYLLKFNFKRTGLFRLIKILPSEVSPGILHISLYSTV